MQPISTLRRTNFKAQQPHLSTLFGSAKFCTIFYPSYDCKKSTDPFCFEKKYAKDLDVYNKNILSHHLITSIYQNKYNSN